MHDPSMSVAERFSGLDGTEFREQILELWDSGRKIVDTVIDQVENGPVTPLQGLGVIGCVTSQLYGYNAFHGEPSSADMLTALSQRERSISRS